MTTTPFDLNQYKGEHWISIFKVDLVLYSPLKSSHELQIIILALQSLKFLKTSLTHLWFNENSR